MREILFRGKRIDTDEWVEGYYAISPTDNKSYIYAKDYHEMDIAKDGLHVAYRLMQVCPTTVGQFTGLTDKNGKKIFEGDFVVVPLSGKPAKGIVEYFKTDICGFTVITQPQYSNYVLQKNYAYEVIGNIHDNPELLEVTG